MGLRVPQGFHAAPLRDGDIDAVVALVRQCEAHDSGRPMYERADLVGDLAQVDREHDALVVRAPGGQIVAWALVLHRRSRWADVAPVARERGIGRALVGWSVDRASVLGADRIGQTIDDRRTDAVELMRACGAVPVRTAWVLRRPAAPEDGSLAVETPGITLRDATPDDHDDALAMMELAFSEWPDRTPSTLDAWRAMVTHREGFTDADLRLAVAEGGRLVGASFVIDDGAEIWVDKLATHPAARGRGIGLALLVDAFRRAASAGRTSTALSTDSNTGALPFYERAGMRVEESFTHWAIPLRADLPA